MSERFHPAELDEDHRGLGIAEVSVKRRKIVIARLGEDGVPFPAEIPTTQLGLGIDQNGFDMTGVLRGRNISTADERDHLPGLQTQLRSLQRGGGAKNQAD